MRCCVRGRWLRVQGLGISDYRGTSLIRSHSARDLLASGHTGPPRDQYAETGPALTLVPPLRNLMNGHVGTRQRPGNIICLSHLLPEALARFVKTFRLAT